MDKIQKITKTDEEWRKQLTPEQYTITREKGTERRFCGVFHDNKKTGIYHCVCCDLPLFESGAKFDSGTGWPSFFQPVAKENVDLHEDRSYGMSRVECLCARCDSHLGHVFNDGPPPTRLRFCINSASLEFHDAAVRPSEGVGDKSAPANGLKEACFGAGCFWGVEETFRKLPGVTETAVGFMGGTVPNVSYKEVCGGDTKHAEVVYLKFDPSKITFKQLLEVFWSNHNPTTRNRQGPDEGDQYRSAVFVYDEEQRAEAEKMKAELEAAKKFSRPIVTEIVEAQPFYAAEEYHQKYLQKRGQGSCSIH